MKGSGLEEVFGILYGKNVVELVLSGKDYARATRGHFLVHSALLKILADFVAGHNSSDGNALVALHEFESEDNYRLGVDEENIWYDL